MQLQSMYQEIILDHYRHPVGREVLDPFDVEVHHVNPTCGDEITLRVRLQDGVVTGIGHQGQGCSISQASVSVMTELLVGQPLDHALDIEAAFLALMQSKGVGEPDEEVLEDAVAFAGVSKYPARVKCALLGWMAFKDAAVQATRGRQKETP
jgi:nitrogen fixation NifU-like protein